MFVDRVATRPVAGNSERAPSAATEPKLSKQERREASRYPLRLPMRITRIDDTRTQVAAQTCNISLTGALFCCGAELRLGERISYSIEMPARVGAWLICEGVVVRCEADGENRLSRLLFQFAVTLDRYRFVRDGRSLRGFQAAAEGLA